MPRHVPDDFSFLPTVDSTDEELMELEEQRKAQAPWHLEEAQPQAQPHTSAWENPHPYEHESAAPESFAPAAEDARSLPAYDHQARAAQMEQAVNELLNREVTYDEPPVQDLPPEQQDGRSLWKEFWKDGVPPPLGEAVEEDPNRFESGAPTVTVVLSPAEAAAIRRAAAEAAPSQSAASKTAPKTKAAPPEEDAAPEPSLEPEAEPQTDPNRATSSPSPTQEAVSTSPSAERTGHTGSGSSKTGRRALVDTPPVSFGGRASGRDKSGRRKDAPAEKPPLTAVSASAALSSHTPGRASQAGEGTGDDAAGTEDSPKPFIAPKPPAEAELDPDQQKKLRWRKLVEKAGLTTLGWSVGAHLVLLFIAGMWGLNQMTDSPVDFVPGGGSSHSQAAEAALTNTIQHKKNPWIKAKPMMRKVTVQSMASDIVLPEMPMDALDLSSITNRMDISKASSMGLGAPLGMGTGGAGGGFGAGIGRGGKFSFVGQTALGRRVVFVVDVSGSMSAISSGESISRFDLLKKELAKSVNAIPMGTQYQILFFSDFAWPHDQVNSNDVEALTKYRWDIAPDNFQKVKLPPFRFIQATPFSIRETIDIIEKSNNPGGTNWGSGLLMALNASPKPDVIFFMTDGLQSDEMGWVDIVTAENKRRLPMTTIHTSAMQQPDAARELDDLARRNNGKFSVVMGDGKIVRGEDFFKMKR